ncbi:FAD/NAD(P)-binding oxidoreductase [Actinomadura keratinilytica]
MRERLVVIGGDAAGMSAASQARRLKGPDALEIVAFERGHHASYSACGIPYWVAGDVDDPEQLVARTPEEHRARHIDLRMRTEVTEIDVAGGRVRSRRLPDGQEVCTGFDKLVIATGARPVRPPLPGIDAPGVHGVQTLDDGQALLDTLRGTKGRHAVVVGAGYIGVEMAEALLRRDYEVTLLNRAPEPMTTLDPDMGKLVHEAVTGLGIELVNEAEVTEIRTDGQGRARAVVTSEAEYPADVVVLGIGVRPEAELAEAAGLPVGDFGGILTDQAMRVRGQSAIWAAATAWRCWTWSPAASGTSRSAPTPTSRARSSAPTWAAVTRPSPASSARPSARSATWRSPGPDSWRRRPARPASSSSRRPWRRPAAPGTSPGPPR